jgi:formylglycine-generating enzyme required for sulfatase activity
VYNDEIYKISLNSTYPSGWTALNSRKIGGFHYGKVRGIDETTGKPVNASGIVKGTKWQDYIFDGIVPRSVWTLGHRPKCAPEGMVYLSGGTWVDIYLNSNDGKGGLQSKYGATPMTGTEGLNWYDFAHRLQKSGKRMPTLQEYTQYAYGSPEGLADSNDYAWTATTNSARTTTGYVAKAVSAVGVRDAVGNVYEWLDEIITRAEHKKDSTYHASEAWSWDITTPLLTGEDSDIASGNIYEYYAQSIAALIAGGDWGSGAIAGVRCVRCYFYPWGVLTGAGVRGACDSL